MNLLQLFTKFQDNQQAIEYLEQIRWKDEVICTKCGSNKTCKHREKTKTRWQCWNCHHVFSVTVGTIFHHSHVPLNKWFMLIALMLNAKKGLSSLQASRDLGLRPMTTWSMMHRIRKAMTTDQAELLKGIVEMDECYIGGKPRKENKKDDDDSKGNPRGRGTKKEAVVGAVERMGNVKVEQVSKMMLNAKGLLAFVRKNMDIAETLLVTDEYKAYNNMGKTIAHYSINHSYEYARGDIHTNTIESFWAILKRGIIGQFHKVSKKYLQQYLDEFEYRYNRRNLDTKDIFNNLLMRVTYGK
jgi:transposase-like protein